MSNGFVARKFGWMAVCALAGVVAVFAYSEGQVVKESLTVVGNVGQLAEPFIMFAAFWAAIGVLLLGTVQLFRS